MVSLSSFAGPSRRLARPIITFCDPRRASTSALPSSSPTSSPVDYPYSSTALHPPPPIPTPHLLTPRRGTSLIDHLNTHLRSSYDPLNLCGTLFSRRHPDRLRTGSILNVLSYTNGRKAGLTSFSGILMGMRRRGVDTSFRLRNVVHKTGVEMSFKVCSPLIKEIKVVKRAEKRKEGVRDLRRAKVNYLRERPQIMAQIAGALKEEAAAAARQR